MMHTSFTRREATSLKTTNAIKYEHKKMEGGRDEERERGGAERRSGWEVGGRAISTRPPGNSAR